MRAGCNEKQFCLESLEGRLLLSADPTLVAADPLVSASPTAEVAELFDGTLDCQSAISLASAGEGTAFDIFEGVFDATEQGTNSESDTDQCEGSAATLETTTANPGTAPASEQELSISESDASASDASGQASAAETMVETLTAANPPPNEGSGTGGGPPMPVTLFGIPEWSEQGQAPTLGGQVVIVPGNPVSGPIESIAVHPTNGNIIFIGTVNGGIWRTNDNGTTWQPLTDQFPSLSIGSIAFSPLDATNNTLFAGTGQFDNGFQGGNATGLLRSTDGGNTWTDLGANPTHVLNGNHVKAVVPTSIGTTATQVILVAAANRFGNGGLFRSIDGGVTFTRLNGGVATGLPAGYGSATDLIVDPNNAMRFYAALPGQGVFRSNDGGATWAAINTGLVFAGSNNLELSAHDAGATTVLYAGVINGGALSGVFRDAAGGDGVNNDADGQTDEADETAWAAIGAAPAIHPGNQGFNNFSILADRTNANLVYVGGDRQGASPFVANMFVGNAAANTWNPIVLGGALGTAPHADSRDMVFDLAGNILESDDGGLFRLVNLGTPFQLWISVNGNLRVAEYYSLGYDSLNNILIGGTQDTGSSEQSAPGSLTWNQIRQGDGNTQAVAIAGAFSVRYTMGNNFNTFVRRIFDNTNTQIGGDIALGLAGLDAADTGFTGFSIFPYEINRVNPARLLIGGQNNVYESNDQGDNLAIITPAGVNGPTAFAYGGRRGGANNADVAYLGFGNGNLYLRTTSGGAFNQLNNYNGNAPQDIVLDPDDWQRAYITDGTNVFFTPDAGVTWTMLTGNLGAIGSNFASIELFTPTSAAGDDVVLVGGLGGVFRTLNPEAGPTAIWTKFGSNLPNVLVNDVQYNAADDRLHVGTHGRAAWRILNASAVLTVPGVLQITGDQDYPGQDDVVRLELDANNPLMLLVFINNASNAPNLAVPLSALQQINVDLLGGNDRLLVNSVNGLIAVPLGIRYNGGVGSDLLQARGPLGANAGYALGPNIGAGKVTRATTTSAEIIFFTGLEPVQIRGGGAGTTLTIQAPDSANAINYVVGPNSLSAAHPVFAGDRTGFVSVDTFESVEFSNFATTTINAGAGRDSIHLNNATTPTALTGLTVRGEDDTVGDVLVLNGFAATVGVNVSTRIITGANGSGGNVPITFASMELLTVVAGTSNRLSVSGSVDYTVDPSQRNDEGTIHSGPVSIQFAGYGAGQFLELNGTGELILNGTAANDTLSVAGTTGHITTTRRATIERAGTLSGLVLNGLEGKDLFYVTGVQPYTSIEINGGSGTNDLAKLTGNGTAMTLEIEEGVATVTGGGLGTLHLSGIALATLNAANANLTAQSTAQDDLVEVTPVALNSGRLTASELEGMVSFSNTGTFSVNLLGGQDALSIRGSAGSETILVSGTVVEVVGREPVNYSQIEHLEIASLAGSDIVQVSPSAVPVLVDGGDPIATATGDLLTIVTGGTAITLNPGPQSDEGSFNVGANGPVSFDHVESFSVTGGGPLVVNGTNGPDAITLIARDASTHAGTDGVKDFTVSINGTLDFLFLEVALVTIQALGGSDEVTLRTPAPNNADWDVDVTVNGGGPSGSDRLVIETPGATPETATFTPSGVDAGTFLIVETNPLNGTLVTLVAVEELVYDGEADHDHVTVIGTAGTDTTVHRPGATADSGRLQVNTWLALDYQSLGASAVVLSDGAGGVNTLVYDGTQSADVFVIERTVSGGQVLLNDRVPFQTLNTQSLIVQGFGGDDAVTLVPAIQDSPYSSITVNGGEEASSSGDILNLVGSDNADLITISGRRVSAGGVTVDGTGIEETRLDALDGADQITYQGVAGLSEAVNLIGSGVAGSSKLLVAGVATYTLTHAELFDAHANDGSAGDIDTLRFTGTNQSDVLNIDLNAAGTLADPILEFRDVTGTNLLLTLFNYTGFRTLNVFGEDGQDFFHVYTGADIGRELFVDGGLPAGKRRTRPDDTTDELRVYIVKAPTLPRVTNNAETQNQNSGFIEVLYDNGTRFPIQYDNMEFIDIVK